MQRKIELRLIQCEGLKGDEGNKEGDDSVKLRSIEKINPNVKLIVPEKSTIMMGDKGIFSTEE